MIADLEKSEDEIDFDMFLNAITSNLGQMQIKIGKGKKQKTYDLYA